MIVYFSGTGNSRFAAEFLAKQLDDELLDAGREIKEGKRGPLFSERPWVFVSPTYAWRLPHVFTEYIENAAFSGNRNAYFILTCGGDIGNAGKFTAALALSKKLVYRGILEAVMPENYIAMFDVPDEQEIQRLVEQTKPVLEYAAEQIRSDTDFQPRSVGVLDHLKSGIVNKAFYKLFVKSDAFYATDYCNACGYCVTACPLNNISLVNGRPVWRNHCTHCMACICGCPSEAIEYGKKTKGKPRYRCPKD